MKVTKLIIAFVAIFAANAATARGIVPVCIPCETVTVVKELGTDTAFTAAMGEKLKLVYLHKEYGVLWIPIWNQEGKYVLSNEAETKVYDIDLETEAYLKTHHNFEASKNGNPISFWKKFGGKLILLVVILFGIRSLFKK